MFQHLTAPGRINDMTVRNRLITGPLERAMATPEGVLTQRYIDYMKERAIGGASLVQLESAFVDLGGRGNPYQVGCHDDAVVPALTRMADVLHEHGTKLAMELHHGGRQASPDASGRQPIAPSPIPNTFMGADASPREMTHADIAMVTTAYVHAAERCLAAGVDMIHLHGAHGYLLGQFLSPRSNQRDDEYGGGLANRARFPLEVLKAVRDVVGPKYPIGYRISATEFVPGGLTLEDSAAFCEMLAEAGIDLIDVAGGTYESMRSIFQGPNDPPGGFLEHAAAIKRRVGDQVPVSVAQRLADPVFAQAAMVEHSLDFVTLARAFHADPYYAQKLSENRPSDVLPCIGCNACLAMAVNRKPAGCAANPQVTFERTHTSVQIKSPRKIVVVGGGVAGMHTARMLAQRGHQVKLVEQSDHLGGQLRAGRVVQPDQGLLVDWLHRELDQSGVEVYLRQTVDLAFLQDQHPDEIIIATGASSAPTRFVNRNGVVPVRSMEEAILTPQPIGDQPICVLGASEPASHTALHLARIGHSVLLVDSASAPGAERPAPLNLMIAEAIEENDAIEFIGASTIEELVEDTIEGQTRGHHFARRVSGVVNCYRAARTDLAEQVYASADLPDPTVIGDADRPQDILAASSGAARATNIVNSQNKSLNLLNN